VKKIKFIILLIALSGTRLLAQTSSLIVPSYIGKINQVKFTPNEDYVMYATTGGLKIYRTKDGKELRTLIFNVGNLSPEITEIHLLKNNQEAFIIGRAGYGYLDLKTFNFTKTIVEENGGSALLSADEKTLYFYKKTPNFFDQDEMIFTLAKRTLSSKKDSVLKASENGSVPLPISTYKLNERTGFIRWKDEKKEILSYGTSLITGFSGSDRNRKISNNKLLKFSCKGAIATIACYNYVIEYKVDSSTVLQGDLFKDTREMIKKNPALGKEFYKPKEVITETKIWEKEFLSPNFLADYLVEINTNETNHLAILNDNESFIVFNYETGESNGFINFKSDFKGGNLYDYKNTASCLGTKHVAVANITFLLDDLKTQFASVNGLTEKYNEFFTCNESTSLLLTGTRNYYKTLFDNNSSYFTSSEINVDRKKESGTRYAIQACPLLAPNASDVYITTGIFNAGGYVYKKNRQSWDSKGYLKEDAYKDVANIYSYSPSGKYFLAASSELKIKIFSNDTIANISTLPLNAEHNPQFPQIVWSKNEEFIYIDNLVYKTHIIACYNVKTGSKLWQNEVDKDITEFMGFGIDETLNQVIAYHYSGIPPTVYQTKINSLTGKLISSKEFKIKDGTFYILSEVSSLYKLVALCCGNTIKLFDLATFAEKTSITIKSGVPTEVKFYSDKNHLLVQLDNGSLALVDIDKKKQIAIIVFYENTSKWLVHDNDGRFDGSQEIFNQLYFTINENIIPTDGVFEKYYTPNLLGRILNGEVLNPVPDINKLVKRPTAKIQYAEKTRNLEVENDSPVYQNTTGLAEITINAAAPDDAIDEIRLFHNGKIVTLTTRNLIVADDNRNNSATKKYTINLLDGLNNFRAVALNTQRTESLPDDIVVAYNNSSNTTPANNAPSNSTTNQTTISPVDKNATLHLIVVGINQYQNKSMVLNYALADATAFKDEMEKDAKSVITNIKTYFVTDNEANKTGFEKALNEVKQNAKPKDVFIFYYAGHGVIGKDKEFYLVPNDVSDLKNVQAELEQKGIPAKLLQQYAIDIPAQKQLFILDACQSAGAFNEMLSANGDQQKSIAVVSRSTGTHWMAASGAQQFANEFSQLGHGAFTYVLLEALKGSAASNKMITVNGLKNYLQLGVPELMKKYSGTLQYPASYGFGNDFPVEVLK